MAPTIDVIPHAQHFSFHNRPAGFLCGKVGAWQEHLAYSNQFIFARVVPGAAHLIIEKWDWNLQVNTCAITGHTIGINRATVPDRLKRFDPVQHHITAFGTVNVYNQTNTTGRMFFLG